jgi:predicted RNA-binding Zn-ribbon protein involved in translation (DUF1610 family)
MKWYPGRKFSMKYTNDPDTDSSLHCPLCGSTSVTYRTGGYGGMIYRCKDCGYMGAFVVEVDDGPENSIQAAELSGDRFQYPKEVGEIFLVPLWVKILAVLFLIVVILYIF